MDVNLFSSGWVALAVSPALEVGQTVGMRRSRRCLSAVPGLHRFIGPATVLRFIVSVIVNAIQRVVTRWLRPHVGEESRRRTDPPVADRDASATVVGELGIVRIETPLLHSSPGVIFGTSAPGVPSLAVDQPSFAAGEKLTQQASATSRMAASDRIGAGNKLLAAVAPASPPTPFSVCPVHGKEYDPIDRRTGPVFWFRSRSHFIHPGIRFAFRYQKPFARGGFA